METLAAPLNHLQGHEIEEKYLVGTCLAEGDRHAIYETTYQEQPAFIKIFRPEWSRAASDLLASLDAGKRLVHPNLISIYDFGQTTIAEMRIVYAVMERADENLAEVLGRRVLDQQEMRELLEGVIPALEFLHEMGFVHTRIRPANVLACGDRVKLSSDHLRPIASPPSVIEPPGLHDAPETGAGEFGPASDVWSLAVITLQSLTGSPLESSLDRLPAPYREIVQGGLIRSPRERWTLARMTRRLRPQAPLLIAPARPEERGHARYRRVGPFAIAALVVAGALTALVIRGARETPPQAAPAAAVTPVSSPAPPPAAQETQASVPPVAATEPPEPKSSLQEPTIPPPVPSPVAATPNRPANGSGRPIWGVVGASYNRRADAEKRVASLRKSHPELNPAIYPDQPDADRYLVVFGTGMVETEARRLLDNVRRLGAPPDSYATQLR